MKHASQCTISFIQIFPRFFLVCVTDNFVKLRGRILVHTEKQNIFPSLTIPGPKTLERVHHFLIWVSQDLEYINKKVHKQF